jgi:hypothetical protein
MLDDEKEESEGNDVQYVEGVAVVEKEQWAE